VDGSLRDYDAVMYLDALSFLEDERDAFRAYEALDTLTDEELDRPVEAAGGWSGRDLMGHMTVWQEAALASAKELAVEEASPTMARIEAEWGATPGSGDRINADALAGFRAMPIDEVRRRFRETAGELRGYLTVVPESRWIKHAGHQEWFFGETIEHYEDHAKDLRAILEAARQP
jgi:DinB superfamily